MRTRHASLQEVWGLTLQNGDQGGVYLSQERLYPSFEAYYCWLKAPT